MIMRQMDVTMGRFIAIDTMEKKYYNWSPYVYCINNTINIIDLDRRDGIAIVDKEQKIIIISYLFTIIRMIKIL